MKTEGALQQRRCAARARLTAGAARRHRAWSASGRRSLDAGDRAALVHLAEPAASSRRCRSWSAVTACGLLRAAARRAASGALPAGAGAAVPRLQRARHQPLAEHHPARHHDLGGGRAAAEPGLRAGRRALHHPRHPGLHRLVYYVFRGKVKRARAIIVDRRCAIAITVLPSMRPEQLLLDRAARPRCRARRRLVEHEDRRVLQDDARDRDALALAARELDATLADVRLVAGTPVPVAQRHDEVVRVRLAGGRLRPPRSVASGRP